MDHDLMRLAFEEMGADQRAHPMRARMTAEELMALGADEAMARHPRE